MSRPMLRMFFLFKTVNVEISQPVLKPALYNIYDIKWNLDPALVGSFRSIFLVLEFVNP